MAHPRLNQPALEIAQTEVKEHEPDQVTHTTHNVTLTDQQETVYRYVQSAIDAEL